MNYYVHSNKIIYYVLYNTDDFFGFSFDYDSAILLYSRCLAKHYKNVHLYINTISCLCSLTYRGPCEQRLL